jgi:hypothetical protein
MSSRGQGIALDFLFAVLVFLLVLNSVMTIIDSGTQSVSEKNLLNNLNAKASQTMDLLVRTDGNPNDWEKLDLGDVVAIGLAKRDRALDEDKVGRFFELAGSYSSSDYNAVKSLLLIGYDYYFELEDSEGLVLEQTGTPGDFRWEDMMQVTVQRVVNYNGVEVIAELSIYYPR